MRNKPIIIIFILGVIAIMILWRIYDYYHPPSVLVCVPDGYRGKLIIKENTQEGRMLNGAALENFGDYVYEFWEITDRTAYVENMTFLLNAEKITACELSVAPLDLRILTKNKDNRSIIVEILTWSYN